MRTVKMFRTYNQLQEAAESLKSERQQYILIADENPAESELIASYLKSMGHNVKQVKDGVQALHEIKNDKPLLVISSINIEGIKGYQLCHILKGDSETSAIPFMFVSASDSTPDKTLGFQQGCDDYITVPLDSGVLKHRVDSLLRRSVKKDTKQFEMPFVRPRPATEVEIEETTAQGDNGATIDEAAIEHETPQQIPTEEPSDETSDVTQLEIEAEDAVVEDEVEVEEQVDIPEQETEQEELTPPETETQQPAEEVKSPLEAFRAELTGKIQNGKAQAEKKADSAGYEADVWGEPIEPEARPAREQAKPLIQEPAPRPTEAAAPQKAPTPPQVPPPSEKTQVEKPQPAAVKPEPKPETAMKTPPPPPPKPSAEPERAKPVPPTAETRKPPAPPEKAAVSEPPPEKTRVEPAVQVDEDTSPKLKTAPIEVKIRADAGTKLNLPTRRQIAQADNKQLYRLGIEIIEELRAAKGVFGLEDFLLISAYLDKLAEKATADNELLSMVLSKDTKPTLPMHSVNCSIIALRIGKNLQIQAGDLPLLGIAGFLFDIGMIKVNSNILSKEGEISSSERREVQKHVYHGVEIIEAAIKNDFTHECKYITTAIMQHHERESGQGYPNKLTGDQIIRSAKIIGVSDTYEALCHSRFYRSRQTSYRALQEVVSMKKTHFDPVILRALVNELTFFPIGCYVKLNTDEIGVVTDTSPVHSMRPKLKILTNSEGLPLDTPKVMDLVQAPFLYVVKPLEDEDIPDML